MAKRMTLDEIERAYRNEWVVVKDFVPDENEIVKAGVVVAHAADRIEVHRALDAVDGDYAMWFVGPPSGEIVGYIGVLKQPDGRSFPHH